VDPEAFFPDAFPGALPEAGAERRTDMPAEALSGAASAEAAPAPADARPDSSPEAGPDAVAADAVATDADPADGGPADAAPPVLAELIAAGLVSHEMIGDPSRIGGEANGLRALCALVAGPVYRVEAYHYAFRAGPQDLDGRLATLAPGEWTAALEAALAEAVGEDAAWLNPTDLLPEAEAALAQPLLLLRAHDRAVTGALEAATPELQAVINARYAAECARITLERTAEAGGPLADRLAAIEARQAEILERLEAGPAATEARFAGLERVLERLADKLEAQEAALARGQADSAERLAEGLADRLADRLGNRIEALSAAVPVPGAFQETLGVTLAEFLARIEQRAEADRGAPRMPQLN
jgi:hypothetical protein